MGDESHADLKQRAEIIATTAGGRFAVEFIKFFHNSYASTGLSLEREQSARVAAILEEESMSATVLSSGQIPYPCAILEYTVVERHAEGYRSTPSKRQDMPVRLNFKWHMEKGVERPLAAGIAISQSCVLDFLLMRRRPTEAGTVDIEECLGEQLGSGMTAEVRGDGARICFTTEALRGAYVIKSEENYRYLGELCDGQTYHVYGCDTAKDVKTKRFLKPSDINKILKAKYTHSRC
jgi:hypothetical protein